MRNRQEEIRAKGFNVTQGAEDTTRYQAATIAQKLEDAPYVPKDFSKIKIGRQTLNDAILDINTAKKVNPRLSSKEEVFRAIDNYDLKTMREISNFYYRTNGIYHEIIVHLSNIYNYDYFVSPTVIDKNISDTKVLEPFYKCLKALDNFKVKETFGQIALNVLKDGAYYGYKVEFGDTIVLQQLPINYCRSRFFYGNKPAVEFNMKYFSENFRDTAQRARILKMFPKEFEHGYSLYRQGKLTPDAPGDENGWYLLDPEMTVKFNLNGEDCPTFISTVPLIIDLIEAQALDKQKVAQRLNKLIIQQMPFDKNGDLIFDVDEAQQLHNNAVQMVGGYTGAKVLTTFADVEVASLADSTAASAQSDDLERVERQLYNSAATAENLFNPTGGLALEKSLINDAAKMYSLLLQFENFLNEIIQKFNNKPKNVIYEVQLLKTTKYNYQDMAKMYKEQMQVGFSKMLPQICLGQSQSSILANAYFENDILDLVNVFIPPLMSSTLNENILNRVKGGQNLTGEDKQSGRKELADDKKSEKTIANIESKQ